MFPFAFGVPLSSRHNSPAVTRSPPRAQTDSPNVSRNNLSNDLFRKETYAEKKANWKSSLRKPHPFLSREPNGGYQVARSRSNSSRSNQSNEITPSTTVPSRPTITLRHILSLAVIVLSAAVLIVGMIYADNLTFNDSDALTGDAGKSIIEGDTKGVEAIKEDKELLFIRDLTKEFYKRQDVNQLVEPNPATPTESVKSGVSSLLKGIQTKVGKHRTPLFASLFFYVAALPVVSIIHACFDLAMFSIYNRLPRRQNGSSSSPSFEDDDSFCESDTEDINVEKFKHELAYPALPVSPDLKPSTPEAPPPKSRFQKLARVVPLLSLISTVLVLEGWAVINGIQAHCELVPSGKGSKVCPSPMGQDGIGDSQRLRQMSMARTALSWAIVLIYIGQIIVTLKQNKIFSLQKFRRAKSNDTEANANSSPRSNASPRTPPSILSRSRSRSNASRRKTVRFDMEEASRRQSERGEDVQYIPAPSDGYDNGYGLAYNYSSDHAYNNHGVGGDVRTPWQWQGQFEEFVNRNNTSTSVKPNPVMAATMGTELATPTTEPRAAGSFDFGLASMRRLAREENAALATKAGFIMSSMQGSSGRVSQALGLSSNPSTTMVTGLKTSNEQQARAGATDSATSAVVPFALSSTAVPFKPKITSTRKAVATPSNLRRNDTFVSAMTNGRSSIDLGAIDRSERKQISPLSS